MLIRLHIQYIGQLATSRFAELECLSPTVQKCYPIYDKFHVLILKTRNSLLIFSMPYVLGGSKFYFIYMTARAPGTYSTE
jgi:hypothetical protein